MPAMTGDATDPGTGPAGDRVVPFLLERPELRGRLFRAETSVDSILTRHAYPASVAQLLGELLVLGGLLSSLLKFDGVFTLQTKGDGPVRLMVVDVTSVGALRGYAEFDGDAVSRLEATGAPLSAATWLNKGQLVFTVELGGDRPRHQGIVALDGETLADCIQHYFRQSEQLKTATVTAVRRRDGGWRAGGLLLQQLPENQDPSRILSSDEEDAWRRAVVLMATCRDDELLDPALPADDLLFRLFHEEQVRVFAPRPIAFGCRCSREKIETTLRALPRDDVKALKDDGEAVVTCQFCNTVYRFDDQDLDAVMA